MPRRCKPPAGPSVEQTKCTCTLFYHLLPQALRKLENLGVSRISPINPMNPAKLITHVALSRINISQIKAELELYRLS